MLPLPLGTFLGTFRDQSCVMASMLTPLVSGTNAAVKPAMTTQKPAKMRKSPNPKASCARHSRAVEGDWDGGRVLLAHLQHGYEERDDDAEGPVGCGRD